MGGIGIELRATPAAAAGLRSSILHLQCFTRHVVWSSLGHDRTRSTAAVHGDDQDNKQQTRAGQPADRPCQHHVQYIHGQSQQHLHGTGAKHLARGISEPSTACSWRSGKALLVPSSASRAKRQGLDLHSTIPPPVSRVPVSGLDKPAPLIVCLTQLGANCRCTRGNVSWRSI